VSATGLSLDVARELRAVCGEDYARERPAGGVYVSPGSAEEVAAILKLANQHHLSVAPAGGSTEQSAALMRPNILLHLNRLTQVEHYDHADLTVGVGAGTTVAQLNTLVGADRLLFACDPPLPERATVGGILATASHGPLRHGYGALRDFCIGIHFVTGDGRRAKGGGRVVKNVAGYDLMKLLIGSYGTLAVITSASFKLFPAPRQTRTFLAEFATAKEALEFRDRVMRSPLSPMCLELVSPGARKQMRPEVTDDAWVMCLRAAGSDTVLARYRKELGSVITKELEGESESRMWRAVQDYPIPDALKAEATIVGEFPRINLTVPLNKVAQAIEAVNQYAKPGWMGVAMVGRVGVGHLMATNWPDDVETCMHPDMLGEYLRGCLPDLGSLTVDGLANPWCGAPGNEPSLRAVKQALDPNNVLRGRVIF